MGFHAFRQLDRSTSRPFHLTHKTARHKHAHTHTLPSHTHSVVYSHTLWVKLKTRFVYFSIINYDFVIRFDSLLLQKYLCHQHHPSRWRIPPSSPGRVSIVSDKHELIGRGSGWDGGQGMKVSGLREPGRLKVMLVFVLSTCDGSVA